MITDKLKKHISILQKRANEKAELARINSYQNQTLNKIIDAFLTVKNSTFSAEELAVFKKNETYRQQLLNDLTPVSLELFGSTEKLNVREICKRASSPPPWCQFLFMLARKLNSKNFLEIGTNLGVSGTYLLEALTLNQGSHFVSMEGHPQFCGLSNKQFSAIAGEIKFQIIEGLYKDTFQSVLSNGVVYDTLFIDGNHKKDPTLHYFAELKNQATNPSVFIFDDINWDTEMKETWKIIKQDPDVNYSIDLYKLGIVVLDKEDKHKNINLNLHLAY